MSQIYTSGNPVFPPSNLTGTGTSTNGSTVSLITHDLGSVAAVYRFIFYAVGRDTGSNNGVGYTLFATAKTDGATATVIATPFDDSDEDALLVAATADVIASGNNVILQVVGVAGETIAYKAVGSYVVV